MIKKMFHSGVSVFFSKSSFIVCSLLAANLLTVDDYSKYGLYFSAISMVTGVAGQALLITANRYYSDKGEGLTPLLLFMVIFTLLVSGSYLLLYAPDIFSMIEKLTLLSIVVFCLISSFFTGVSYSRGKASVVSKCFYIPSLFLIVSPLFAYRYGVFYILVSYLIFFFLSSVFLWFFVGRGSVGILSFSRLDCSFSIKAFKKTSFPVMLSSIVFLPVFTYVLFEMAVLPGAEREIAIFTISNQVKMMLSFIPLVLSAFFITKIISGDETYKSDWNSTLLTSTLGACLMIVFGAPILIAFNYGVSQYSLSVLFFMVVSGYCSVLKSSVSRCLIVKEGAWFSVASNIAFGMIFLTVYTFLSSSYGVNAFSLSLSFLLSQVLHSVLSIYIFIRLGYFDVDRALSHAMFGIAFVGCFSLLMVFLWK